MAFFIGRCKHCKATARLEPLASKQIKISRGYGRYDYETEYTLPTEAHVRGTSRRFFLKCLCQRFVPFERIMATETKTECGARCINATGPACDCSCKGRNHGGVWAV